MLTAYSSGGWSERPVYRSIDNLKGKKVRAANGGFQETCLEKKAHKRVAAAGGKFILRNLSCDVRSVIDLTGFSRILTVE